MAADIPSSPLPGSARASEDGCTLENLRKDTKAVSTVAVLGGRFPPAFADAVQLDGRPLLEIQSVKKVSPSAAASSSGEQPAHETRVAHGSWLQLSPLVEQGIRISAPSCDSCQHFVCSASSSYYR